jgi:hypothetical protein
MTRAFVLALTLAATPFAAMALPVVGDVAGTSPEAATAALKDKGCEVQAFEPEDGKIEAKCTDTATGDLVEVYIDPKTGAVADIKLED